MTALKAELRRLGERVGGELRDGEVLVLGDEALCAAVELAEALEAGLGALLVLVHVAGAPDREAADVKGGEDLAVHRGAKAVGADLVHVPGPMPPGLLHTTMRRVKTELPIRGGRGRDGEEHDEIRRKGTSL